MNTQEFVSREDALEILFANRNRAYGAYQLRRQYPAALAKALGLGLLLITFSLIAPQILKALSSVLPEKESNDVEYKMTKVEITPPPPQPKLLTPPPPAKATQAYVPPVVDKDENVAEDPPKLSNDDLLNDPKDIGAKTVEGPAEGPPTLDNDPGLTGVVEVPTTVVDDEPKEIFDLQIMPSFPGGEEEMMKYLSKNIIYPEIAREAGIQGLVVLNFVIGRDGSINDVTVLRELGGGCTKEAIRVVKSMPRWRPGEAHGNPVKVRFTLPVRFKLN